MRNAASAIAADSHASAFRAFARHRPAATLPANGSASSRISKKSSNIGFPFTQGEAY
jgi:hypothetical protein